MGGRIIAQSQDRNDLGSHDMILLVTLIKFEVTLELSFQIVVEACTVYDIHVTHPPSLFI